MAVMLAPHNVFADEPIVRTPAPRPNITTSTGNAVQSASAGPEGLSASVDVGTRTSREDATVDPRRTTPSPAVNSLLVSLATSACNANQDTWVWEVQANAPNGFWCAPGSAQTGEDSSSLEGEAIARIKLVPWPDLVIESNPIKAIVAVPTYYWIRTYDGSPRRANPKVTIQEGETCHDLLDEDGNPVGRTCVPNMVTYAMTITATPTNYLWSWDDVRQDPHYWRWLGTNDLPPMPNPTGLGIPFVPPQYPESPVVHVYQDSSYYQEPTGYTVKLTLTYDLTWAASGPGGRHQGGSLGQWEQTASVHQHVMEIQVVHCLPEIKNSCP
jgi:hypothetical protein